MSMELMEPLTDLEIEELNEFLQSLSSDEAMLGISELDGLLTAVVSGPDAIPPSIWMNAVWDGEENAPEWESPEQATQIMSLMVRHMNSISTLLMESPDDFEPLFLEGDYEGEPMLIVDDWCEGYIKGVKLGGTRWQKLNEEMERCLSPILAFGLEDGLDMLTEASDEQIEAIQQEVAPAARRLHAYWLAERSETAPPGTYFREDPKIGRNDPCPCGSGKKYKKCCGLN